MFRQAYESILRQLEEMPRFLERVATDLHSSEFNRQPAKDKSALLEHFWHIRDCETDLYVQRIRRTLKEDQPYLDPERKRLAVGARLCESAGGKGHRRFR